MTAALELIRALKQELHRVIVGQEALIDRLLVALVADGHVLLEGVPGLAKTMTLSALAQCVDCHMSRVQFTPDLLPSDLVGTEVYRPSSGDFVIRKGPIFANIVLADEINRAPAKVQSALLQAMQEREVTIGEATFVLPRPFLVLATQNPIEQEGTYELPEAQLDRFLMKVKVTYPSYDDELKIVRSHGDVRAQGAAASSQPQSLSKVVSAPQWEIIRHSAAQVSIDPRIDAYIVSLVRASRDQAVSAIRGLVEWGASPRGGIALRLCSRALAAVRGEKTVTPEVVKELAPDVLRHRIIGSFEADARGVDSDEIIRILLRSVTVP